MVSRERVRPLRHESPSVAIRSRRWWGLITCLIALMVIISGGWTSAQSIDPAVDATPAAPLQTGVSLDGLAATVADALNDGTATPASGLSAPTAASSDPVFAVLRGNGTRLGSSWAKGDTTVSAVQKAVTAARSDNLPVETIDTIELCLTHSYQTIDLAGRGRRLLTNVHVGVLGIEIDYDGNNGRYSPTLMLAQNWDFTDVIERFAKANEIDIEALAGPEARVQLFACDQVLVSLGDAPRAVIMERGNQVVPLSAVTSDTVTELAGLLGGWLIANLDLDGRMTYAYWPSRTEESGANNMIRQWMATVALTRFARANDDDPAIFALAERNIRYNLETFYEEEDGLGLIIEPDGDVKLGAVALAALAIVEHPERAAFAREEAALRRTVDALWQEDGSFQTFYRPADRDDNQNFYPGEALLLWATLYVDEPDPALLDRFMTSFQYYRDWHLDETNRNPAFVPWHTQADYLIWQATGDPTLRDFIFEMNDWLLAVQQWDAAPYPDLQGRFYDPDRPEFGPPHASSTGVYLEGLIDAYRLAVEVGDDERAARYQLAIRRGLRDVMQLQYQDEIDLFYVDEPERVRGGLRTEVYDNVIRVDNVQHNLMAVLKILQTFTPDDYTE